MSSTDTVPIEPVSHPLQGSLSPPGSKSLTNRALIVAALADRPTRLKGLLASEDTHVMIESLTRLGLNITHHPAEHQLDITGCAGHIPVNTAKLWLENSGTSIRFLTALCCLGEGDFLLDGNARMRERPIGDLIRALQQLNVQVACQPETDCPPVQVHANGLAGGEATVAGNISSQYLSALLMSAPLAKSPVKISIEGELVSKPYVKMTLEVMKQFGVQVFTENFTRFEISPQLYTSRENRPIIEYAIEPDASAASYFFAAAAITGGEVTVQGLSLDSLQGDVGFVNVLAQMGCLVQSTPQSITVKGGTLRGVDVDMNAISDTAQTLAAVAPFAEGVTRIRNVQHMRHKETDRIAAVANELKKLGIRVEEFDDGLAIHPGPIQPATIQTYDDHRMAMSFSLIGLRAAGIQIADPGCTAKTYPHYFDDLNALCHPSC